MLITSGEEEDTKRNGFEAELCEFGILGVALLTL